MRPRLSATGGVSSWCLGLSMAVPLRCQRFRHVHGFAAIELAIVLAILGILVAVAAPSYVGSAHRDASPTASNQIKVAVIEAEAYRLDNATYRARRRRN